MTLGMTLATRVSQSSSRLETIETLACLDETEQVQELGPTEEAQLLRLASYYAEPNTTHETCIESVQLRDLTLRPGPESSS